MPGRESEVKFFSEYQEVHGTMCVPDGSPPYPAVALLHGYGAFRDELTGYVELAALLAEHGIASLRFDFRGCGESGEAGRLHPHDDWVEDTLCALSFLEARSDIAGSRLGVVGMSVGGGIAVQAAALDDRVCCAVALAPVADGGWWLKHLWTTSQGETGWHDFLGQVRHARRERVATGMSTKVPIESILAYGPDDLAAHRAMHEKYPQFATHAYYTSVESLLQFQPRQFVHKIRPRPIRFIHSLTDTSVPIEHSYELFGRAGHIRDLQVIHDSPHCFWIGPESRHVQELTVDWLSRYL
jgi:hypothetical protein